MNKEMLYRQTGIRNFEFWMMKFKFVNRESLNWNRMIFYHFKLAIRRLLVNKQFTLSKLLDWAWRWAAFCLLHFTWRMNFLMIHFMGNPIVSTGLRFLTKCPGNILLASTGPVLFLNWLRKPRLYWIVPGSCLSEEAYWNIMITWLFN